MSGIGWTEFFLIALILLIFVGPQRLPELFGKIAWVVAQLRSASRDLRNQIDSELSELQQAKSDFTAEMKAQTDRLYAEARQIDEEYKTLQDDVNDARTEVKEDLKAVKKQMAETQEKSRDGGGNSDVENAGIEDRELKG